MTGRPTVPMVMPPGVAPSRLVSVVYLQRSGEGECSAVISDVAGRVPMERRQVALGLRALADELDRQADELGTR